MTSTSNDSIGTSGKGMLDTARSRIRSAFDPHLFHSLADRVSCLLRDHLDRVQAGELPVLNWNDPPENITVARAELENAVSGFCDLPPAAIADRFEEQVELCLSRGQNLHHPRYIGHQVPASLPIAGLFDAVGAITNQVMAIYEMGPFVTSVERVMVEALGEMIGYSHGQFAGLVTSGGSLANLTGLLTARNVALGDSWRCGLTDQNASPVLVAHADAHYSTARAAGILGIGTDAIIPVRLDSRRRMDPQALDDALTDLRSQNVPIIAVAACACATPIGAFDPLHDIADVCQRHEVWLHVDAAHGGGAAMSPRHRHLVAGLELADSAVCDAHKMLFVPALCAFVFYKNRDHRFATFEQAAPYLFDPSVPGLAEYDSGLVTVECTKRAAAMGLWGTWSLFGPQLFADMVDVTIDLGQQFYEMLVEAPDFEPLHEPQCNIVAFRHLPPQLDDADENDVNNFQLRLRRSLIESGEFYIVSCSIDGQAALRVTIINPLTKVDDLHELLVALRRHGDELLKS